MPLIKKPMRYAHPEGHTGVCYYSGEKGGFITCGSDGDVRAWLNLMDDDPAASCIAEQSISVISKNGKIYVGNDNNTVQVLSYPDLEKDGICARFTAAVSALATTANSKYIASGGCDMRIMISDIETSTTIELEGHKAPILGLSLDPKEEFLASSSADGTIKVWNIKDRKAVHTWQNVLPKSNSFFTAKTYGIPSFDCKDGHLLAYPLNKEVVIVERGTWKELYKLQCSSLKTELSICKFSECGTRLAASSIYGEIVIWNMSNKEKIGYIEHSQNSKITAFAWQPEKPEEIVYCDALGQLGCIEVTSSDDTNDESLTDLVNDNLEENEIENNFKEDDDEDDENVISINKVKASVELDIDQKSVAESISEKANERTFIPDHHIQAPFQIGSTPGHLISRYMVFNDVGMVRCFTSEDGVDSSIEVEFHDVTIHRSIHMNNYLGHTMAALSSQALALCCPQSEDTASKLVVVVLQGWGTGNKEWYLDLPEGEEGQCVAVGNNFVAVATTRRNLRICMIGGIQREVISLPGQIVTMNALGNSILISYHNGIGLSGDQNMKLLWIQIHGMKLRSQTLHLSLSPSSTLMWLGFSDRGSPAIMDSDDMLRIYDKKSCLWNTVCDLSNQTKGKTDHYFLLGISEIQQNIRCILCKGSYYPPTSPKPIIIEIPLIMPLCETDSERVVLERKLWQFGHDVEYEDETVLSLIALACRSNVDYRAVDICQEIASQKVIDLAIKYARRLNRTALANKLENIADTKEQETNEKENGNHEEDIFSNGDVSGDIDVEIPAITSSESCRSDVEIKPLSMNDSLSVRRSIPFLKTNKSTATLGLTGMNKAPEVPQKPPMPKSIKMKPKVKNEPKKESFVAWYAKKKNELQEEFPELSSTELAKYALQRYKDETSRTSNETSETKKRKLSGSDNESNNQTKKSNTVLSAFCYQK